MPKYQVTHVPADGPPEGHSSEVIAPTELVAVLRCNDAHGIDHHTMHGELYDLAPQDGPAAGQTIRVRLEVQPPGPGQVPETVATIIPV